MNERIWLRVNDENIVPTPTNASDISTTPRYEPHTVPKPHRADVINVQKQNAEIQQSGYPQAHVKHPRREVLAQYYLQRS
ncbi:MAG: hypothetical protein U5N86_06595 [Planctomycetota bacterium]|nr:hypothetical protein [Planctomycetota bacterium]